MTSELIKRLQLIDERLQESNRWFRLLANYCRCLNHDLFMVNSSLEDECSTIARIQVDSWLCEIERQQNVNSNLSSISSKLILISAEDGLEDAVNRHIGQLGKLDASIQDGYLQGKSNRPVEGLLPCKIEDDVENAISQIEIESLLIFDDWNKWNERITAHLNLVNKLVTLFPASHPFSSIPCSISILLNQVRNSTREQDKLERTLKILTESGKESHDAIFGLDVLIILGKLRPIPISGDEQ